VPAPTIRQSTSVEGGRPRCASAGLAATDAAEPARKLRREISLRISRLMVRKSWFAIGFTLHREKRKSWQNRPRSAKPWLTIDCLGLGAMNGIATSLG
jgi:hypothetical protein